MRVRDFFVGLVVAVTVSGFTSSTFAANDGPNLSAVFSGAAKVAWRDLPLNITSLSGLIIDLGPSKSVVFAVVTVSGGPGSSGSIVVGQGFASHLGKLAYSLTSSGLVVRGPVGVDGGTARVILIYTER